MRPLHGVSAVITGGTAGIGLAIARALLERGARPIIVGRSEARLSAALDANPGLDGFVCDVTNPAAPERIREHLASRGVGLRLLINNAGVQHARYGYPPWSAPSVLSEEIDINVSALVRLTYALLPDLAEHAPSALVNVSSGLALAPKGSAPIYCATKSFVRAFTRAMRYRVEDACLDIHVMELLPPLVDTSMTRGRSAGAISPEQVARAFVRDFVAGRKECLVGKVKLLAAIQRVSPDLAYRIVRSW